MRNDKAHGVKTFRWKEKRQQEEKYHKNTKWQKFRFQGKKGTTTTIKNNNNHNRNKNKNNNHNHENSQMVGHTSCNHMFGPTGPNPLKFPLAHTCTNTKPFRRTWIPKIVPKHILWYVLLMPAEASHAPGRLLANCYSSWAPLDMYGADTDRPHGPHTMVQRRCGDIHGLDDKFNDVSFPNYSKFRLLDFMHNECRKIARMVTNIWL